ncbi:hypothetical protein [Segnochrobactrum spirostomi]|uniref:Uncharacterized protein n=1 Tax=Segnochrobactrum spirostomi TaxID=2608987 RepID=A0A6A7Y5H1_9HYPH|nr:hypothetical protein [Segnochrobactrum spirostomi]MQT13955.1 hypothetical protein [Segnochrobactrum spirostomi]
MNDNDQARRPDRPAQGAASSEQEAIWRAGRMVAPPQQPEATVGEPRLGNVGRRILGGADDPEAEVYGEPNGPRPPQITVLPKDVIDAPPAARNETAHGDPAFDDGQGRYGPRDTGPAEANTPRRAGFIPGGPSDEDN